MKKEKIYINFPLMVPQRKTKTKAERRTFGEKLFFHSAWCSRRRRRRRRCWGYIITKHFFIFQLASIPSSKSQYRKASLWEKQISSDDDDDAPAGICVVAVYRSFNNLQALELTQ